MEQGKIPNSRALFTMIQTIALHKLIGRGASSLCHLFFPCHYPGGPGSVPSNHAALRPAWHQIPKRHQCLVEILQARQASGGRKLDRPKRLAHGARMR
jgi:hypothetical protein